MIKKLIFLALFVVAAIVGISLYLQPDDLRNCGQAPSTNAGCQPVDAIVAISGGDTQARANEAIKLYKNGWSSTLIFSGAAQDKTGPSNAAAMKAIAVAAGVPISAIQIDEYSETTKQNAQNAQTMFAGSNIKSIILVTSGYHQRRASLEFSKSTHDVTILNHSAENDSGWSFWWWINPTGWFLAMTEIVKIIILKVTSIF